MGRIRVLLGVCLTLLSFWARPSKSFIQERYTKREARISMRDGVRLFTIIYTPKNTGKPYPVLLTRTPYSVEPYGENEFPKTVGFSEKCAEEGFIFVYQDVRGRFESEGTWVDMRPESDTHPAGVIDESTDTYDTIDWLLKNVPNNNGKVGLYGTSYPGFYTTAGLIDAHPALAAASPQAPIADLFMGDDCYHNGAFFLMANFDFYTGFHKQDRPQLPVRAKEFRYGTKDGYDFFLKMGPVGNAETYFQHENPYWSDTVKHTSYDEFWRTRNILPHLRDIRPAVLVVGGWFDDEDLSGTLNTYRAVRDQSPSTSDVLVMGPWQHGAWQQGRYEKLGQIAFGSNTAQFFHDEIEMPFFLHHLKGRPKPDIPAAYVFKTGANTWDKESQWPPADARPVRFFLHGGKQLSTAAPEEQSAFDEYVSDANHPVPFYSRPTIDVPPDYMDADQRFVQNRPDVLSYISPELTDDLDVAGPVSSTLHVSSSGTDSDFVVMLIDVYPADEPGGLGGYEQMVRGEPFRSKFRNSFEHPEALSPGEVEAIHFSMPDVCHRFGKRHRLMVQIQSSWFPLVDRNPQTFTDIPNARPNEFVKATERIYRSKEAASFVELSVERWRPPYRNP